MTADATDEGLGAGRLRADLVSLGVAPGSTLMVHSSLRAVGWVPDGAATVIGALIDSIGPGTLVMPAATPQCADSGPRFDPSSTPTPLGVIPETFRTWTGTLRSDHPLESVCARGAHAEVITAEHPHAFSEGPDGPFGRLDDLDAWILLLGVGFNRCTALHYAETLAENRRTTTVRFQHFRDGQWTSVEVPNVADDNDTHFPRIGRVLLDEGRCRVGRVGRAPSTLFRMRDLVRCAARYFGRNLC